MAFTCQKIKVADQGWNTMNEGKEKIDMTTFYILYSGRRDCFVDVKFNKNVSGYKFATGIINVKNSVEFNDKKGLRGCWGTDWPVALKDSAGHKPETVGLGICIPQENIIPSYSFPSRGQQIPAHHSDREMGTR